MSNMIKGIGVDIAKISRFENKSNHFIQRILSKKELEVYSSLNEENKIVYLASRFSAKEALFKALKTEDFDFSEISVLNEKSGAPYIQMDTPYKTHISISHEKEYVICYVLVEE